MCDQTGKTLILTVGLPRSGKSTWARAQGFPIVNPDAIRLALHGQRFLAQAEPLVWAFAQVMVASLLRAGHGAVIVDATNVTAKRRDQWREWFPDAVVEVKVIGTGPQTCKARAIQDNMPDLVPVIERMAAEWDLPKPWGADL